MPTQISLQQTAVIIAVSTLKSITTISSLNFQNTDTNGKIMLRRSAISPFEEASSIFSPSRAQNPIRIDFFGDNVDSIRIFDPITQRSIETIETFTILPFRRFKQTNVCRFADQIPEGTRIIFYEPSTIAEELSSDFHKFAKTDFG